MKSTSSIVRDHLMSLDVGTKFTVESLIKQLNDKNPLVSPGGVSGFISRCATRGVVTADKSRGRDREFTLANKTRLSEFRVQLNRKIAGKNCSVKSDANIARIREVILECAAELEQIDIAPKSIRDFSTTELMDELSRRLDKLSRPNLGK